MSASSQPPAGTFLPNTKVTVGSHKVYIEKYLSEGGFAHVYVVRVPRDDGKHDTAVLKRVAVPDKEHLANLRTEVDTMKKLKGHKHIVTYIDSHASQLKGGGYEVFLLMEYCSGGGLIDFMNTRLQHRLTEPEILKLFGDCAEGVACMHYLKPPLLHRDLKVENVLISKSPSGSPTYKICDFGSTAPPRPAAKTVEEGRLIEEDVQKHTTMQYRSPEMIDVWRKQPIDEKADIWALGVLLYKLCYYTTPFEDVGQMAILNATYKFPSYPAFSERLKKLIAWMLMEDPKKRPNIYQVIKENCSMRGKEVPIKDIYTNRTHSEARRNETLPSVVDLSSAPVGLQKTAPQVQIEAIPDIAPMRRGRLPASNAQAVSANKPAPSPARGDPFAALDSKNYDVRSGAVDELSKRFPSVDDFSITHNSTQFAFSASPQAKSSLSEAKATAQGSLNERVANALADEVFASKSPPLSKSQTMPRLKAQDLQAAQVRPRSPPKPQRPNIVTTAPPSMTIQKPGPVRSDMVYRSTATGSSPSAIPRKLPEISARPIWHVPEAHRSLSQPRASDAAQAAAASLQPSLPVPQRPGFLDIHRSKSQTATLKATTSSRPSLENGRPIASDLEEADLSRTKSLRSRSRPTSMYVNSDMDFLRNQEQSRKRPSLEIRRHSRQPSRSRDTETEESAIVDDMDYLRKAEEQEAGQKNSMRDALRTGGHHRKRSSFDAIRAGTKNILGGRFGDAFKRFESSEAKASEQGPVTPEAREYEEAQLLSPIVGSEATATPPRHAEVSSTVEEMDDLTPDARREVERRRLSLEERRVAEAAAEYRARVGAQGTGPAAAPTRASTIQKRVQSLLDEGRQSPQPRKTAEGYGKYTSPVEDQPPIPATKVNVPQPSGSRPPVSARKPNMTPDLTQNPLPKTRPLPKTELPPANIPPVSASAPPDPTALQRVVSRPGGPSAPPKPKTLRTGGPAQWPPPATPQSPHMEIPPPTKPAGLAALLAKDLEGVPDYPARGSSMTQPIVNGTHTTTPRPAELDDLDSFSKRYPSLGGIEVVETQSGVGRR